jgi:hypothetical protein
MESTRADDDELGVLGLGGLDEGLGRIAAEHADSRARRQPVLARQLSQPAKLMGGVDGDGAPAARVACRAQDVHERDFAVQVAGQPAAGGGGAIAAARVIDAAQDVTAHSVSEPLVCCSLSRALQQASPRTVIPKTRLFHSAMPDPATTKADSVSQAPASALIQLSQLARKAPATRKRASSAIKLPVATEFETTAPPGYSSTHGDAAIHTPASGLEPLAPRISARQPSEAAFPRAGASGIGGPAPAAIRPLVSLAFRRTDSQIQAGRFGVTKAPPLLAGPSNSHLVAPWPVEVLINGVATGVPASQTRCEPRSSR